MRLLYCADSPLILLAISIASTWRLLTTINWVWKQVGGGLVLLVLVPSGCSEWTISPCAGTPFKMPSVGPCAVDAEPGGPTSTHVTMPLAVVIHGQQGRRHCQEIQP